MTRAGHLLSFVMLAAAVPCAADGKGAMKSVASKVVEAKSQSSTKDREWTPPATSNSPSSSESSSGTSNLVRSIASRVLGRATTDSSQIRVKERDQDCTSLADCPLGSPYGQTFEEVWQSFGKLSDSELWEVCLGRADGWYGYRRDVACMMTAYPHPWRPVDVPRRLEHAPAPFREEPYDPLIVDESGDGSAEVSSDDDAPPCEYNATLARKRPVRECAAEKKAAGEDPAAGI